MKKFTTFSDFKNSKVEMTIAQYENTYGKGSDNCESLKALVYMNGLLITVEKEGKYALSLGNEDWLEEDLVKLEIKLFEYFLREFYHLSSDQYNAITTANALFFKNNPIVNAATSRDNTVEFELTDLPDIKFLLHIHDDMQMAEITLTFPI